MFHRCTNCDELRMASYSFCPGCYATGSGAISSATYSTPMDDAVCAVKQMPRLSLPKLSRLCFSNEVICVVLLAILVLANLHPQTVSNTVQQIYTSHKSSTKIANLCALDLKAQADNDYSSEFTYWKAWVGAISNGQIVTSTESKTPQFVSVKIPQKLTKHQAMGRARFYRTLYVGMRRQFLPQKSAVMCSIAIYDRAGHLIAACDQNGIRS